MNTDYLMAIDAGTGGSRCLIFDTERRLVTKQYSEWNFNSREDIGFMAKDLNPEEFWNSIILSIKKAIIDPKIDPSKIRGISTTSYREGFFLLDENAKELYAAPADDMRAISQGMNILGKHGDKLYHITGRIPPMLFASAKITWFKEKEPETYKKIRMLLMMNDWIIYKLTGLYSSEPSAACETELFDIKNREWSKELISLLELPDDIYPPIYNAGTEIGAITNEVSGLTGLEKETPVVVGGADSECCLLGMGLINNGETGIIAGTTTPIQMVLDKPIFPSKKLWTNCHLIPDKWNLESNAGPSGKLVRWLRDTLAIREKMIAMKSDKTAFELMDEIIEKIPPCSNNSYSFFGPMVCDWSNLKPLGMGGFILPLPIDTDTAFAKGMILRSYFENMAYVLKLNFNQLEEISGIGINKTFISGGLANSKIFNEIITNVLNIPVYTFKVTETTGLGAAICVSIGTDLFADFKNAINSMVKIKEILEPNKDTARVYRKSLRKWSKYQKILSNMV
jgi:autoinducer 2 (AI-2) kinase